MLDGVIQLTERDEFAYHEIMVHVPLCAHSNPRRVLIVGGGDGGVLREVCRHSRVEEIVVVEIDPQVVQVAKTYFTDSTATAFEDPRIRLVHSDAAQFLANHDVDKDGYYDVILGDTSDPIGPAESLFQPAFYESMYAALRPVQGIVCVQAECFWIHLPLISDLIACCLDIGFDSAEYATTMVPTYPCGQIGFLLASKGLRTCQYPREKNLPFLSELKWYSPSIHVAAFTLPEFVRRRLRACRRDTLAAVAAGESTAATTPVTFDMPPEWSPENYYEEDDVQPEDIDLGEDPQRCFVLENILDWVRGVQLFDRCKRRVP